MEESGLISHDKVEGIPFSHLALTLDASHDSVRSLMHSYIAFFRKHIKKIRSADLQICQIQDVRLQQADLKVCSTILLT